MNLTRALRKHMKKLMIIFAALLALALGMTATMSEQIGSLFKSDYEGEVFGRTVSGREFAAARYRLMMYWTALYGDRINLEDNDVWEHLAILEEAKQAGIVVTDRELQQDLKTKYRSWRLVEDIRNSAADQNELRRKLWEYQSLTPQQRQARLEAIPFDSQDYKRILSIRLNVPREELGYSLKMFSQACMEFRLRSKLSEYLTTNILASTPSVYDSFVEEKHQRKIDYLYLNSENYADRVKVEDKALEKFYKEREHIYKEPERITFEYVMARYDDLKASIEPTAEELKKFYDDNKFRLFMRRDALRQDTERPPTPDQMVKPYAEVRAEVKDHYLRKKAEEKARELVDKVRAEINALEEITFLKAAEIAARQGLHAAETKPFAESEYSYKLEHEFGFCPQAQRMFDRKDEIAELSRGKFEEPQPCDKGIFTYRLSKFLSERTSPLAEVRDKVVEAYIKQRAGELAKEEAERILKKAREAGQFTTELLEAEKLARISTDFFKNVADGGKILAIEESKTNDVPVINAAYTIATLNHFAEKPVEVAKADTPLYYLVQYKGRKDPAAREFVSEWTRLLQQEKSDKLQPLYDDWKKDLLARADIKKTEKKKPEEKKEGEPGDKESEKDGEKKAEGEAAKEDKEAQADKNSEQDKESEGEPEKQSTEDEDAGAEKKSEPEEKPAQEPEKEKPAQKPEGEPGG